MVPKKLRSDAEEKLIEQVRARPYLFNLKDAEYKNKEKKQTAWSAISTIVGLSGNWH
jgi:hypothetical protein